jgi:hypothetical protein
MSDDDKKVTPEELEDLEGEPLPERTQMSLIGYPGPVPVPGEISIPEHPDEA